jgi:hypothetical protein
MAVPLITEEELTPVNSESIDWFSAMSAVVGELDGLKSQVSALQVAPAPTRQPAPGALSSGAAEVTLYGMLGTIVLVAGFVGYQALNRPDIAAIERSSVLAAQSQQAVVEALGKKERPSVTCVLAFNCPNVPAEPVQEVTAPIAPTQGQTIDALYRNPPAIPPEDWQVAITNVSRWRQEYSDEQIAAFVAQSSRDQLGADPVAYQVTLTAFAGAQQ